MAAGTRLVVVVDQFEELFTLCGDAAERNAFIDALVGAATRPGSTTTVLLALRADFSTVIVLRLRPWRQPWRHTTSCSGQCAPTSSGARSRDRAHHGAFKVEAGFTAVCVGGRGRRAS